MKSNNSAKETNGNGAGAWRVRSIAVIYSLAIGVAVFDAGRLLAATGDYTQPQAAAGHQVFSQHCAQCHGSALQGQSGPPLAGPKFKSNLEFSKMSATQLFAFIRTQMPYNAPGSLSKKQYLQALSYILSQNGYPQGSMPLSEKTLPNVKLLPYPGKSGGSNEQAGTQSHSN